MDLAIFFRYVAIILGGLIGIICLGIFKRTKKDIVGWKLTAIAGILLAFWAIIQTGLQFIISDIKILMISKSITSLIFFSGIAIVEILALIKLCKIFMIELNKLYTERNIIIIYIVIYTTLIISNLLAPFDNFIYDLGAISLFMIGIMFLIALYPAYMIHKNTKKWFWTMNFIFVLFVGVGCVLGVYQTSICNDSTNAGLTNCAGINPEYAPIITFFVNDFLLIISGKYHIILMIALLSAIIGYYNIYKRLA
jgi:hypothetical protein